MGGDYYDRDVITTTNNTYSEESKQLDNKEIHSSLKPTRWTDENLVCDTSNPIVFALDVTGSMGDWAKIIYDKMPLFYGQIMMQKYLVDPSISFCAIGDHTCTDVPLQITEFGQGKAIDQLLKKMVLWMSGNGNEHESYELAAYFYENNCDLINPEMGFFFITGDEGFFDKIEGKTLQVAFGKGIKEEFLNSKEVFKKLMKKFNVFHVHKPYMSANYETKIRSQWVDLLGEERVLDITNPKACIDIMLGAVAITSGRTLEEYINDMKIRGQTQERIDEVSKSLLLYSQKVKTGYIKTVTFDKNPMINVNNNVSDNNVVLKKNNENLKSINNDEIIDIFEKMLIEDSDENVIERRKVIKEFLAKNKDKVPKEFICPLVNDIFYDPVLMYDGVTYERKAIEIWMNKYDYSPVSGAAIDSKILLPNFALKQMINDFIENSI